MHVKQRAGRAAVAVTALLASGCGAGVTSGSHPGASSHPNTGASASVRAVAAAYLRIAEAGNHRLETDFDGLEGPDRDHLAAARADLRDAAATEHLFDQRLMAIRFPPTTEEAARMLFRLNEARARLTAAAAGATTLAQLRSYEKLLTKANVGVEREVRTIRSQLGLPPPATS